MKFINMIKSKLNLTNNKYRVMQNIYWAMIGKFVKVFTEFLVGIFVARYLGPEQYGLMNYVISFVTIFSIIATFGLDDIEIRELAKNQENKNKILGTSFRLRIYFALLTLGLISLTLYITKTESATSLLILIYTISIIFSTLNVVKNYFISIVLNKYIVLTEIIRCLIGAAIKVILLLLHADLIWFIISLAFDFMLLATGYYTAYKHKIGEIKKWYYDIPTAKLLIKESFPLLLSGTAIIIYQKIDQIMIYEMIDDGALGLFSVANSLTGFALFVPTIIAQTITPILVDLHNKNHDVYKDRIQQFIDYMLWSSIAFSIILGFVAYLIPYIYGKEYTNAIIVLQILSWKLVGSSLSSASGQLIILEGIQRYAVIRNIIGCIICISLNFLLIPIFGINGAAISAVITVIFSGYLSNYIIKPYRKIFMIQSKSFVYGFKNIILQFVKK